jgi:S-adenosylmethionine synthetase
MPIDRPHMASAEVLMDGRMRLGDVSKKITDIVERELSEIGKFCIQLSRGKYRVC